MRIIILLAALAIISCQNNQTKIAADAKLDSIIINTPSPTATIDEQLNSLKTFAASRDNIEAFITKKYPKALQYIVSINDRPYFDPKYINSMMAYDMTLVDRMQQYNTFQTLAMNTRNEIELRLTSLPDTTTSRINKQLVK